MTVIQLDNGQKHCIHPSYLKEMQASSYSARSISNVGSDRGTEPSTSDTVVPVTPAELTQTPDALVNPDEIPSDLDDSDDTDTDEFSSGMKGDPDGLVEEYVGPQSEADQ